MLSRRLVREVVAAVAVLSAACGSGGPPGEDITRQETVPVQLRIVMRGDINVDISQAVQSNFVVRRTTSDDTDLRKMQVVGVEPVEPVRAGVAAILAGVGVTPYEGDRTYTIPVGSPIEAFRKAQEAGMKPDASSSIKVEWWATGDPASAPEVFMRRVKPCTVAVTGKGTRGSLTCPEVTDEEQRKRFSLLLEWVAPRAATPPSTSGP